MLTTPRPARPLLLVLGAIVSVQFGGALAATLVPQIGAGGSVTLRLLFATAILWVVARPRLRGHSRAAWLTVLWLGAALGLMNLSLLRLAGAPAHRGRCDHRVPRTAGSGNHPLPAAA